MSHGRGAIWIAWEKHRRSRSLADRLGIPLEEFESRRSRWLKHPAFVARTMATLVSRRPGVLFVQSPSLILNLLVVCLRPFLRYRLVVDAHNAGVYSCDVRTDRIAWLYPWLHRHADVTIVSNQSLAAMVARNGGRPLVLIDPLPDLKPTAGAEPDGQPLVTFICTFATDEPFNEVLLAASRLTNAPRLLITGNFEKNRQLVTAPIAANVAFTGFLPEEEFVDTLARSHVIVDLTTFDDCLVCGAYEAIAIGTPLVLSDTSANREVFPAGAVYCANEAGAIAAAIDEALARQAELRLGIRDMRRNLEQALVSQLSALNAIIQ